MGPEYKFNVGDHVQITRTSDPSIDGYLYHFKPGTTGIIIKIHDGDVLSYIVQETHWGWILSIRDQKQFIPETCLELIK